MKKTLHQSKERGTANHGWLQAKFSFSFANYYNQKRMGFGPLRVLNNDIISPTQGFPSHTHHNMEIITIPLRGELRHTDSTGAEEVIKQGQIQVMSAGSGITHSEYNHSQTKNLELFQIWIEPHTMSVQPRHETLDFFLQKNQLTQIVSGKSKDDGAFIYQNATISLGKFDTRKKLTLHLKQGRGIFLMVIEGELTVEGETMQPRDSIEFSEGEQEIELQMNTETYLLLIEVQM